MADAPERLSELDAVELRQHLQALLLDRHGAWHHADGTGIEPEAWLTMLCEAVRAEARDWDDALSLSRFAFGDRRGARAPAWRDEIAARPHALSVLRVALNGLPEAFGSPEAVNAYWAELRRSLRADTGLRGREVMAVLRAALTGQERGPCLGIVGALLGPARVRRLLEESASCVTPT